MNFKESFDRIVNEVERLIEFDDYKGYLRPNDIISILQKQEGKTPRELDSNFKFISGISLSRYIKDRKMMATYKKMIRDEEYDVQAYVECSGYDNESSFSTAFLKKFGMPPKKAFQAKDESKIEGQLSIDSVINGPDLHEKNVNNSDKIFGLPKDVIDRYNEIRDYQALYGLEDKYAEIAVYLNETKEIDLKDAFETVEVFVMDYMFDYQFDDSLSEIEAYINEEVPAVYMKHLYPDISLPELNNWYLYMKDEGGNALEETPEFVRVFMDNVSDGISYKGLKELYDYYLKDYKGIDDFKGFVLEYQMYGDTESDEDYYDDKKRDYVIYDLNNLIEIEEDDDYWSDYD